MNKGKLKRILISNNIPDYYYNLDEEGETDQRVCLEKDGNEWLVYYSERGKRFYLESFDNEEKACKEVLKRLT
jgi:hypothetical protein